MIRARAVLSGTSSWGSNSVLLRQVLLVRISYIALQRPGPQGACLGLLHSDQTWVLWLWSHSDTSYSAPGSRVVTLRGAVSDGPSGGVIGVYWEAYLAATPPLLTPMAGHFTLDATGDSQA